jgi:hypothetical protein
MKPGIDVIVRDQLAGVHIGRLVDYDRATKTCELADARKIWQWRGALSCHSIAARGIVYRDSKVDALVVCVVLMNVIEIVECSESGARQVREAPEWRP